MQNTLLIYMYIGHIHGYIQSGHIVQNSHNMNKMAKTAKMAILAQFQYGQKNRQKQRFIKISTLNSYVIYFLTQTFVFKPLGSAFAKSRCLS